MKTEIDNLSEDLNKQINSEENFEENLQDIIFNFENDNDVRIQAINQYQKDYDQNVLEITNRLNSMYLIAGTQLLKQFLIQVATCSNLYEIIKIGAANCLCIKSKTKENYDILDQVITALQEVPIPCKIEAIKNLMYSSHHKDVANNHFCDVINNINIECDFRYKTILSLEHTDVPNPNYFIKNAAILFLNNENNWTPYRILASQYLLQILKIDIDERKTIQNYLYSFMNDDERDIDIRADAADILMRLGDEKSQEDARNIITILGQRDGYVRHVFDDDQNVHYESIADSINETLEFLMTLKPTQLDFDKIKDVILNEIVQKYDFTEENIKNTKISLNRITMDRALYGKFNTTLLSIFLRIWFYINNHDKYKEEMTKILMDELLAMSGKCSTGYVGRLINVLSGFDNFTIKISWEDQIAGNLAGRLNAYIRNIEDEDLRDNALIEMTNCRITDKFNFLKVFRESLPFIREDMYNEFKDHLSDVDFDLYLRKAIGRYEGFDLI